MKKIIVLIITFFVLFSSVLAYAPTSNDEKLLTNVYKKLDLIYQKSPSKIKTLYNQIEKIKEKYKSNERVYYILGELSSYSNNLIITNSTYLVKKVIDWDTIDLDYNWKTISVRFIWIDSPESYETRFWYVECYWYEAKTYLKNLIEWKNVNIEFDSTQWQTDKYGRYLAYIFLDWTNINNEMIKNWYAWEYTYNKAYKYQDIFKVSEKTASENKLWLWKSDTCNWERTEAVKIITNSGSINIDNTWSIQTSNTSKIINNLNFSCSNIKTYCTEMDSCDEAKFYLNNCWLKRLDADGDWIPCESICQ